MLESWAALPLYFRSLDTISLGDYDGCSRINNAHYCLLTGTIHHLYIDENVTISNSFPLVTFPVNINITATANFYYGVCIPASCNNVTTTNYVYDTLNGLNQLPGINISISNLVTYCAYSPSYSAGAIVMLTISAIFIFMMAVGTTYDFILMDRNAKNNINLPEAVGGKLANGHSGAGGYDIQGNGETRPLLDEKATKPKRGKHL